MVNIVEKSRKSKIFEQQLKGLEEATSRILCGETINLNKQNSLIPSFIVGDIVNGPLKAHVLTSLGNARIIIVYDKSFYSTARKLAEAYEAVTLRKFLGFKIKDQTSGIDGSWTIKKEYE